MKAYRICTRCVMDTSVPDIEFDPDGVCSYCRAASERLGNEYFLGDAHEGKLEAMVERVKREGAGKRYDCIIGVSGGADSSYVAHLAKAKFGLRPLAIHFDNGWNTDLAVVNIENVLRKLGIDLYTHVVDWQEFRDLQLSFLKSSVANCEIPTDHAIVALLYRMAARHGVRFILHGGNLSTESIMPSSWMENPLDLRLLRAIHRRFGTRRLKSFPTLGLVRIGYYTLLRRIRYVGLLNYLQYDKAAATAFLETEYGWRAYREKHGESMYTRWFQNCLLPKKFGFDKRRPHLSSLIVSGQKTRAEAIEELKIELYSGEEAEQQIRYVCRKFGLSQAEFDELMRPPAGGQADYPNSEWVLRTLAPLVARAKSFATLRGRAE